MNLPYTWKFTALLNENKPVNGKKGDVGDLTFYLV